MTFSRRKRAAAYFVQLLEELTSKSRGKMNQESAGGRGEGQGNGSKGEKRSENGSVTENYHRLVKYVVKREKLSSTIMKNLNMPTTE